MGNAAVSTPRVRAALMWGLPALSFAVVGFAPAGIQLSFVVASTLSMLTSMMFRQPYFRNLFRMEPLEPKLEEVSLQLIHSPAFLEVNMLQRRRKNQSASENESAVLLPFWGVQSPQSPNGSPY